MRRAALAAGVVLAVAALYMATLTLRETCTQINLGGFVRTEFIVSGIADGSESLVNARVAVGGEEFRRVSIAGVDPAKRLKGYRAPVWYLKGSETWRTVDRVLPFRVQSVEEFGAYSYPLLLGGNLLIAVAAIVLLRWVPRP
jgi:hypothetical protein